MKRIAAISPDGTYRTILGRMLDITCLKKCCAGGIIPPKRPGFVCWVLNNPSTADGETDDATIRRLWQFTRNAGYNVMHVVNTNPYRATEPKNALVPPEDVLQINDQWLAHTHRKSALTVCAWGDKANTILVERTVRLLHPLGPLHALRVTRAGNPQHPLYLAGTLFPQIWKPDRWIH